MNFKKCNESDIENNKDTLSDLFISVYTTSFPDAVFDKYFGCERVRNLQKFVYDDSAIVYGAFEDEKLVGFIWGYKRKVNEELRIHIPILIVGEQYQRRGVASTLMEMMKSYTSSCGINTIELMVSSTNVNALEYYDYVGFKEARKLLELRIE